MTLATEVKIDVKLNFLPTRNGQAPASEKYETIGSGRPISQKPARRVVRQTSGSHKTGTPERLCERDTK